MTTFLTSTRRGKTPNCISPSCTGRLSRCCSWACICPRYWLTSIRWGSARIATTTMATRMTATIANFRIGYSSVRAGRLWMGPVKCVCSKLYALNRRRGLRRSLRGGVRGFVFFGVDEPKLLQLVTQRVAADVEQAGGVGLISIGLRHGDIHQLAFHLFQRSAALGNVQWRQAAAVRQMLDGSAAAVVSRRMLKGGEGGLLLRHCERQIFRIELFVLSQNHGALDCVLQLAHIARPVVLQNQLAALLGDAFHVLAELAVIAPDEILHQRQNVFFAFAQWRQKNGDDCQTVVKVLAEGIVSHRAFQITVRG